MALAMASTNCKEEEPDQGVKQAGSKLYSKMLSKEAAAATLAVPSFRVYYGVASAGSVPFLWESQPGTPKNSPSAAALPPLTPPPSYYAAGGKKGAKKAASGKKRWPPAGVISAISLLRRPGRRTSPCSSSVSSSWSSSSMSPVFTVSSPAVRGSGAYRGAFSAGDVEEAAAAAARCFGMERECERGVAKGCGVAVAVRNALATVVGHKSGRRATIAAA